MEIIQVVALGLLASAFVLILRESKPELALFVSLVTGALIFYFVLHYITGILQVLEGLALRAGINLIYLQTLLKIIGIAYVAQLGAQVCRDAGEGATAGKIEFAGKILILFQAVPLVVAVLETVIALLP